MSALYIFAVILTLILAVLLLPVGVQLEFNEQFSFKINFAGIRIYKSKNGDFEKKTQGEKKTEKDDDNESKKKVQGIFDKMLKKYGFIGAIRELFGFAGDVLTHIKRLLRHIKFKKVKLFITVANFDAAQTAISYGAVCAAVYPVLELLQSVANVSYKKIDIKSDFDSGKSDFSFQVVVNLRILFLGIAALKIFKSYKNFITRIEKE